MVFKSPKLLWVNNRECQRQLVLDPYGIDPKDEVLEWSIISSVMDLM